MPEHRQPLRLYNLWWLIGAAILGYIVYVTLTPHPPPMPGRFTDKLYHILGYFVLTGWFVQLYKPSRLRRYLVLGFIILGTALEFAQLWVNTRSFDLADIVANMLGVVLAVLLLRGPLARLLLYLEGTVFKSYDR
jgi:VanZ family protein